MRFAALFAVLVLAGCSAASDAIRQSIPSTPPPQTFEYDALHGAADWDTRAYDYRGRNGDVVAFDCQGDPDATPPSGAGRIYGGTADGRGLFTDDSSVCWAGVFAGAISRTGGRVYIEIRPEADAFPGGHTRNGVSTVDWAAYHDGGFVVLGAR